MMSCLGCFADMELLLSLLSVTLIVLVPTPVTMISSILVPLGGSIWADLASYSDFVWLVSACLGDCRLHVALVEFDWFIGLFWLVSVSLLFWFGVGLLKYGCWVVINWY
jgi:hypothetical protein